jgi:hypothetical protein
VETLGNHVNHILGTLAQNKALWEMDHFAPLRTSPMYNSFGRNSEAILPQGYVCEPIYVAE